MKTLKLLALAISAGYPCVAFAEFAGARVPHVLNGENALAVFSVALLGLLVVSDYSRRFRAPAVALDPCCDARRASDETHRLAA